VPRRVSRFKQFLNNKTADPDIQLQFHKYIMEQLPPRDDIMYHDYLPLPQVDMSLGANLMGTGGCTTQDI
jgi:hypothetical protein